MSTYIITKITLAILFLLLQCVDIYLSILCFKLGGKELNFILRNKYWIVVKSTIVIAITFFYLFYITNELCLIPLIILILGVDIWNFTIWRKLKRG